MTVGPWADAMEIEVRLFAILRKGRFPKRMMKVADDARLADVLRELDISEEHVSLPLVNGQYSEMDLALSNGDVLALFPAIGGG